jgi:hypothetical protein
MPDAGRDCVHSDSVIAWYLLPAQATADMMSSESNSFGKKLAVLRLVQFWLARKHNLIQAKKCATPKNLMQFWSTNLIGMTRFVQLDWQCSY